ncbi:unc-22 [Cordylochernes scorpioides]|uniref:Unc-22 n=1 Tax=Cordylochernes scorpioides TaxID=51811 RepID=A0ABY6KDS4_9ARAC|nr:unc-22 [Cordylochernes scorpioides]
MKLKGRKFDNVDIIQAESKATLRNLSKSDFISCFDNWKKRWNSADIGVWCSQIDGIAPTFAKKPTIRQKDDGQRLLFESRLLADPKPTIEWLHDGVPIDPKGRYQRELVSGRRATSPVVCASLERFLNKAFNSPVALLNPQGIR